jgi:hypothetical protein
MARKRVQLSIGQICVKCGEILPAGMTAYKLSGEHGSGYEHYGKCRGVVRVESEARKEGYKSESINDLIVIIKGGNISERIDASEEIKRRFDECNSRYASTLREILETVPKRYGGGKNVKHIDDPLIVKSGSTPICNILRDFFSDFEKVLHHLEKMTFQAEAWQTDFESLANDPEYKPSYNRETVEAREFLKGMGNNVAEE